METVTQQYLTNTCQQNVYNLFNEHLSDPIEGKRYHTGKWIFSKLPDLRGTSAFPGWPIVVIDDPLVSDIPLTLGGDEFEVDIPIRIFAKEAGVLKQTADKIRHLILYTKESVLRSYNMTVLRVNEDRSTTSIFGARTVQVKDMTLRVKFYNPP